MTTMFQGFHNEFEDEARERWGGTPELAALMEAGADPASEEANALALRHREYISRWFYECSPQVHRGLATLYVSDPRFTKKWDDNHAGLARYVHDAIVAAA